MIKKNILKKIILILLIFITKSFCYVSPENFSAISFEQGMGAGRGFYESFLKTNKNNYVSTGRYAINCSNLSFIRFFKHLYENNKNLVLETNVSRKIPKKIHQIWIGSPLPKRYIPLIKTWKDKHPDYEYKLWTDKEVNELSMKNKKLYNQVKNYGEKADIARLEILNQEGGVYVDIDYECFNSLDILLKYDFFASLRPVKTSYLVVANGLIGATPNHPFIKKTLEELRYFRSYRSVQERTGPVFITKLIYKFIKNMPGSNIILPSLFLLPLANHGSPDEFATCDNIDPKITFAHHYWHANWG